MDATQRAAHANQILENPVFKEAFVMLKNAYTDRLISTKPEDLPTREHMHKSILVLSDVQAALTACVKQGKLENVKAVHKARLEKTKEKEKGSNQ
jgi:hypothetical protein